MKNFIRFGVVPLLLLGLVLFYYYGFYVKTATDSTADTIVFIQEHIKSGGALRDYQGEIGVKSVDDIKLFVEEKQIKIVFGELSLTWKPEDFVTEENQKALEGIGITMYKDKETGRLRVFYKKDEIVRWVQ